MSTATVVKPVLEIRFDRVYGNLTCYPVNAEANLVAQLCGTKTLTPRALELARELGFEIRLAPGTGEILNKFLNQHLKGESIVNRA